MDLISLSDEFTYLMSYSYTVSPMVLPCWVCLNEMYITTQHSISNLKTSII